MIRWAVLVASFGLPAEAARFNFCWTGSGGYTMTGVIEFPDAALSKPLVTEVDVTRFEITGYEDGVMIGQWSLSDLTPQTTWLLRFDPATLTFPTGGSFPGDAAQGWNADGQVQDCGSGGFGFNSGSYAQDICLNGVWIAQSSIDPATPFPATTAAVSPDCRGPDLLG